MVGFIDRTVKTLDIAIFSLTHDDIADAIIRAHQRGVRVRVLADKGQAGLSSADTSRLAAAGVPVQLDMHAGFMHAKYAVADATEQGHWAVLAGSFNWTRNADEKNVEHFQIVRLKKSVDAFAEHFSGLWDGNAPGR